MEKVNCVVVGAGPAGAACAISLAEKGMETVLLERGMKAGEKNVASSVLFTPVLEKLVPDFLKEAPLERKIGDHAFVYMTENNQMQLKMRFQEHYDSNLAFTIYRSSFDKWLAEKAVEAGAELLTGVLVTDLIKENGKVTGVIANGEEIYADVVIGADGINTVVGKQAGLVSDDISRYLLGVKEVLDLPPGTIEERFQVDEGEGICFECLGYPLDDICGATTLYTNNDSVSLAVFGWVDALREKGIDLHERLQQAKEHPFINKLIRDYKVKEYQAHMISDGGRIKLNNLYDDGVLLCGEAGGFVIYYVGIPTAMLSGMMAAEAVAFAGEKGDYSAETLSTYITFLEQTALPVALHDNRRLSDYLVNSGKQNLPGYLNRIMKMAGEGFANEFSFLDANSHSAVKKFYYDIAEKKLPPFMRKPARTLEKTLNPVLSGLSQMIIKRKME